VEREDLQRLKVELLELIRKQTETLENMTFASATNAELREYDERRRRIYQLGEKLVSAAREEKATERGTAA